MAPERAWVHLCARDEAVRDRVLAVVRRCGFRPAADWDETVGTVLVVAARTVDAALGEHAEEHPAADGWLLIAESFAPLEALRALRAGAITMLHSGNLTAQRLAAAVHATRRGDGLIPHEVLVRLLGGAGAGAGSASLSHGLRPAAPTALTDRQLAVLALIADGYGNASIARALACSQHTVKNVIYDMTARLQVRNRAHAVARGVRGGLI